MYVKFFQISQYSLSLNYKKTGLVEHFVSNLKYLKKKINEIY